MTDCTVKHCYSRTVRNGQHEMVRKRTKSLLLLDPRLPGTPAIFVTIVLMDLEQNIPKRAKDGQAYFLFGTL